MDDLVDDTYTLSVVSHACLFFVGSMFGILLYSGPTFFALIPLIFGVGAGALSIWIQKKVMVSLAGEE